METQNEKHIPIYRVEYNSEMDDEFGLSAIGIVDQPAILTDFIKMEKQQMVKLQSEEKRLLIAPALITGMRIYRYDEIDGEYYIYFDAPTIQKLVYKFFKKGLLNKFNLNHNQDNFVNDVYIVESWFTTKNSKEKDYGFNLPDGSWMISVKVDNDEVWNDYIKTGKLKGFSIEAFLQYVKVLFDKQKSPEELKVDWIKELLMKNQ